MPGDASHSRAAPGPDSTHARPALLRIRSCGTAPGGAVRGRPRAQRHPRARVHSRPVSTPCVVRSVSRDTIHPHWRLEPAPSRIMRANVPSTATASALRPREGRARPTPPCAGASRPRRFGGPRRSPRGAAHRFLAGSARPAASSRNNAPAEAPCWRSRPAARVGSRRRSPPRKRRSRSRRFYPRAFNTIETRTIQKTAVAARKTQPILTRFHGTVYAARSRHATGTNPTNWNLGVPERYNAAGSVRIAPPTGRDERRHASPRAESIKPTTIPGQQNTAGQSVR